MQQNLMLIKNYFRCSTSDNRSMAIDSKVVFLVADDIAGGPAEAAEVA